MKRTRNIGSGGNSSPPKSIPCYPLSTAHNPLLPSYRTCCSRDDADEIFAVDRGAPVLFDVFDDQFRATGMTDVRGFSRVIHGVGQVSR